MERFGRSVGFLPSSIWNLNSPSFVVGKQWCVCDKLSYEGGQQNSYLASVVKFERISRLKRMILISPMWKVVFEKLKE